MDAPITEQGPDADHRALVNELVLRLMLSRRAPVTIVLMGMMGFVYGLAILMGGLGGTTDPLVLSSLGAKVTPLIDQGQWWRLIASIFVHVGALHLLGNGYALYFLGRMVENALGRRRFLILFVLSGLGGSAASYLHSPNPSAGASGAIFGLLGAAILSGLKHRAHIPKRLLRQLAMSLLPWLGLALAYGLIGKHVDNAAHLGGLAVGAGLGAIMAAPVLKGPEAAAPHPFFTIPLNLLLGACLGLLLYGALGTLVSIMQAAT